jgi:hypothetical protein
LNDGAVALGQVLRVTPDAMNSLIAAFYAVHKRVAAPVVGLPDERDMIAILFTTRDLLDSHAWKVVANLPPRGIERMGRLAEIEAARYVGARIIGSGNVRALLDAWFGLQPWQSMSDPSYFDKLLLPGTRRPVGTALDKAK